MEVVLFLIGYVDDVVFDRLGYICDRSHLMVSLLRLERNEDNSKVHTQCLKALYLKLAKDSDFLSIETSKSFIYQTVKHSHKPSTWTSSSRTPLSPSKTPTTG